MALDREIKKGDYLLLRYGHGTQIAYVNDVREKTVDIYRLYGRGTLDAKWTGPRPLKRTDPRILSIIEDADTNGITPKPPDGGFLPAR